MAALRSRRAIVVETCLVVGSLGGLCVADDPRAAVAELADRFDALDQIDRLIEQGWWNDARQACRAFSAKGHDAALLRERLDRIDKHSEEAGRLASEFFGWLHRPDTWKVRWSRPVTAGPPANVASIIAWIDDGAVHGLQAVDGMPARWNRPAGATRLFPHRIAARSLESSLAARQPLAIAVSGHLLYAVIDSADDGPMLVCLDCSNSAEGRLVWSSLPPPGMSLFDGPPVIDEERCVIVARGAGVRGSLELVAYDALDGRVAWRQPLGLPAARDAFDHARGIRVPFLHESRVIIADHAGRVSAFGRDGRELWRFRYDAKPRQADEVGGASAGPGMANPIVAIGGSLFVSPLDRGGILAIACDADDARLLWETPPGTPLRIVGAIPDRIVVESWPIAAESGLRTLAASDGRTLGTGGATADSCGPSVMAGNVVLKPTCDLAGLQRSITALDPVSFRPVGPSFPLPDLHGDGNDVASAATIRKTFWLTATRNSLMVAGDHTLVCIGVAP